MADTLTVEEESNYLWKRLTYLSALFCILFFILFWNLNEPFWTGIARFIAFIFFAATVMGYLKLMSSGIAIQLSSKTQKLIIKYRKDGSIVQEEEFDRETILNITSTTEGRNFLSRLVYPKSATFKITFSDTDRELFFLKYGGRRIFFSPDKQQKIISFLKQNEIIKKDSNS